MAELIYCVNDVKEAADLLTPSEPFAGQGVSDTSSGVARVSTASSMSSCSSNSRSTCRNRTARLVLDIVTGHVDRSNQIQPTQDRQNQGADR